MNKNLHAKVSYLDSIKRIPYKKIIALLFIFQLALSAQAGEIDAAYIDRFKTKLNFKLLLNQNDFRYSTAPISSVVYSKSDLKNAQLNYGSYIPFSAGFAFNFMFGGFGYDFRFTKKYFNPANKEVTDFKDFKLNILGRKVSFEGFYDSYKHNYYSRNTHFFREIPMYDSNLNSRHWGLSMRIVTNDTRFSYKAAFAQTEFQRKSAATFIIWYGFDQNQMTRSGGLLLDTAVTKYYDKLRFLGELRQNLWFVMPGFASNLVYQQFYFATSFYVGTGTQFNRQYADTVLSKKVNLPFLSRARASLGFNGKTVYTGIYSNVEYARSSFQSLKTAYFNYKVGVFLGVRIIKQTKSREEKMEEKRRLKEDKNKRA